MLLLLLAVLAATTFVRHRLVGEFAFLDDRVYVDIAVASHLNTDHTYGVEGGQPVPAVRDTLWRSLLALSKGNGAVAPLIPLLWSMVTAALLLILAMAWRGGLPGPEWRRGLAGLLLLGTAPLFSQALSGTSDLLAACLVLGAAMMQLRSCAAGAWPVAPGTAVLLGLAAWLRLDCILWWPLFAAQAVLVSLRSGPGRRPGLWLLLRILNGTLLIAIMLAPLVAWNMRVVGVPWPQGLDGVALDASGDATWLALLLDGLKHWPQALHDLHDHGPLRLLGVRVIFWLGLIFTVSRVARRDAEGGHLLPVVAYIGLPVLQALLSPWIGCEGSALLYTSASALWLPALVEGCWSVARTATRYLHKFGMREDAWLTATRATWLLAAACVLWGLLELGSQLRVDSLRLGYAATDRQEVLKALHSLSPKPQRVATDRPGWLVARGGFAVVDLGGQLTPSLLAQADARGAVEATRLRAFLKERRADAVVLWADGPPALRQGVFPVRLAREGAGSPFVARLTRSGAP
jgi:hypothetical protein